jgi:hypothetical protein
VLLLVLALAALYHGTAGQAVWRELTGYLAGNPASVWTGGHPVVDSGTRAVSTAASAVDVPESEILASAAADVAAVGAELDRAEWVQASATLDRLQEEWLRLSGMLAVDRVPTLDINNFTAILTDTQGQAAERARAAARVDANRLMSEFDVIALDFVGTQAPTFAELKDLSVDLADGVRQHNWTRVRADTEALATIVRQIQEGY